MHLKSSFERYLNDKFTTYALIAMIQRGAKVPADVLIKRLAHHLNSLLETRFFKLLILKVLEACPKGMSETIYRTLTDKISRKKLSTISSKRFNVEFYLYISTLSCHPSQTTRLRQLLGKTTKFLDDSTIKILSEEKIIVED